MQGLNKLVKVGAITPATNFMYFTGGLSNRVLFDGSKFVNS